MIAKFANIFPHHIIAPYGIWPELSNKTVITIKEYFWCITHWLDYQLVHYCVVCKHHHLVVSIPKENVTLYKPDWPLVAINGWTSTVEKVREPVKNTVLTVQYGWNSNHYHYEPVREQMFNAYVSWKAI